MNDEILPLLVVDRFAYQAKSWDYCTSVEFTTQSFGAIDVIFFNTMGGRIKNAAQLLNRVTTVNIRKEDDALQYLHGKIIGERFQQVYEVLRHPRKTPRAYDGTNAYYYEESVLERLVKKYAGDVLRCGICERIFSSRRKHRRHVNGLDYCSTKCVVEAHSRKLTVQRQIRQYQKKKEELQWLRKGKQLLQEIRQHLQSEARAARQSPPRASGLDTTSPTS